MGFASDIKAFKEKATESMNFSVCKVVENLFSSIVVLSPSPANPGKFAKGLLANQYYTEIGGNYSASISLSTNDFGIESLSRIKATIAQKPFLGKDNVVTLTNNTLEAYYAEVLGWPAGGGPKGREWSGNVLPYRMVARSVQITKGAYM